MSEGSFGTSLRIPGMLGALDALVDRPIEVRLTENGTISVSLPGVVILTTDGTSKPCVHWAPDFDSALRGMFNVLTNLKGLDDHVTVRSENCEPLEDRYYRWNGFAFKETAGPKCVRDRT